MIDIRTMTKADFDHLHGVIDAWWGRAARPLLDPIYLHQFGEM